MSWENTLKGQEPKDDPRIQRFLSRQKPEYKLGEENKIARIKELNKLRMELAEKMLDQDGYINMMGFFDKTDAWGTPLSHNWIERVMFDKGDDGMAWSYFGTPIESFEYAKRYGGVSPFYFGDWEGQDTSKKEKLEIFRDLLPSEEGGTMEPVSSKAKPTDAEEEMLGREVFDFEDDPRKRPINSDSGTFPMGFARKPFGSDINVKKGGDAMSWKDILKVLSEDEIREHMSKVKSSRLAEEEQSNVKERVKAKYDAYESGNFVRTFTPERQSDKFIENMKGKYLGYVAAKRSHQPDAGLWILNQVGNSRQEVFNTMQDSFIKNRNPHPWTMEGNHYQGDVVVYIEAALAYNAPSYWYYIADGLDDIPPSNPKQEIRVDRHNPNRVMDRIKGKEFDTEEGELPSEFKDKNR